MHCKKLIALLVASCALGAAFADSLPSAVNGVVTLTVESGTTSYSDQLSSAVTKLIKKGAGTAVLTATNSTFVGALDIQEGILAGADNNFGFPSSVSIADGAAIDISGSSYASWNFHSGPVYIAGRGVNDSGVIICTSKSSAKSLHAHFNNVTMTNDVMFNVSSSAGWGFGGYGTLDMAGFEIEKNGDGTMEFWDCLTLKNPGNIKLNSGDMLFQLVANGLATSGDLSETRAITMAANTTLTLGNNCNNVVLPYGIVSVDNNTLFNHASGNSSICGPITINGTNPLLVRTKAGNSAGRFTLDGPITGTGDLAALLQGSSGEFCVAGATNHAFGVLRLNAGRTVFDNAGVFTIQDGKSWLIGERWNWKKAELVVSNGSAIVSAVQHKNNCKVQIGHQQSYGSVTVGVGGSMTNEFEIGSISESFGMLRVAGGYAHWPAQGSSNDPFVGHYGGHGYILVDDGTFRMGGGCSFGGVGVATLVQRGGLVEKYNSGFNMAKNGWADIYQCGGIFTNSASTSFVIGTNSGDSPQSGNRATITVSGEGTKMVAGEIRMERQSEFTSGINVISGGVLSCGYIWKNVSSATAPKLYMSFDGGTLQAASGLANKNFFNSYDGSYDPDRVTVYAGGAIIDTNGRDMYWTPPLQEPTGGSILSITITSATPLSAGYYIGPPRIIIEGDGYGATAIADFDADTRTVKGIIITSRGNGYTAENTRVLIDDEKGAFASGYQHSDWATVEVGSISSGGLTKKGAGKLSLHAANTYTGDTTIEDGTIALSNADGYPANSALRLTAATFASHQKGDTQALLFSKYALAIPKIKVPDDINTNGLADTIVLAESLTSISSVPELVTESGKPVTTAKLRVVDGKVLKLMPKCGLIISIL